MPDSPASPAGSPPAPRVSILVVSYNTRAMTLDCLGSLAAETKLPHEVIVVDNNSPDGSAAAIAAAFPELRLIASQDNLGFATARTLEKLTDNDHASYILQVLTGTGSLLLAVIGFCAVTVLVFAIVFRKPLLSAFSGSSEWTRLFGRMMLFSMLGILMLVFFGGASQVKDRWLVPLFFVMPLYLALKIEAIDVGQFHVKHEA